MADSASLPRETPSGKLHTPGVWGQEVSARFTRALLGIADERFAPAEVEAFVAGFGVTRRELDDETAWLSLDFCERLMEALVERTGGTEILVQTGRASFTRRTLGFLYGFLRAFANPEFTYRKIVENLHVGNKVGEMRIVEMTPGRCVLEYRAKAGAPRERTRLMCIVRGTQMATVPSIFGLPEARLVENECQTRGGDRCLYKFEWLPARARKGLWTGLAAGGGAAVLIGGLAAASGGPTVAPIFLAALGASVGALFDARREIVRRGRYLEEQNLGLAASAGATERRFAELVEAKREVDQKVEERTAELHEALEKLQQIDQTKNDFFANVSHELRTPLTLILAPLEAMIEAPERIRMNDLATMHRNAVRLLRLINQILDLAKVDAGGMRIRPIPTELSLAVQQVASPFEPLAREQGVALVMEIQSDGLAEVPVDPDKLDMALSNLLANALKFTPRGGHVAVRAKVEGDDALVEVQDDGPGIAEEDQVRIFDRFAQASQGKRRVGTGIGLALVREIALLHGGNVELTSKPTEGALFRLRLPLSIDRIPSSSIERRQVAAPVLAGRRREDVDPFTAVGKRLSLPTDVDADGTLDGRDDAYAEPTVGADAPLALVVEDHDELRAFIQRSLAERYRVVVANDGEEALRRVAEEPPDIVVSDVMMPVMDGYELCRRLKAEVVTRSIPVVLVTAKTGVDRVLEGFSAGADDYLAKPFNRRELLARVEVHLRVRALSREVTLREKLSLLGTVAAGVAHEVRNPLSAVSAILPRIGRSLESAGALDAQTGEALGIARDALKRIERVTRDLLDLSHVDREGSQEWDPREGIEAAVRILSARSGARPDLVFVPGPAATIEARPGEINQVLLNVIDNALRAAGAAGSVRILTEVDAHRYSVEVADDGPGIPPAILARVFDPFFTTRDSGHGTGLGLAIAKKIVLEHLGTIDIKSPPSGGTRVVMTFPVKTRRDALHSGAARTGDHRGV